MWVCCVFLPAPIPPTLQPPRRHRLLTLLLIPINAYISIATTGFVYENIIVAEHQKELAAQQEVLPTAEETLVVTEEILPEVTAEQTELNTVSDETNE